MAPLKCKCAVLRSICLTAFRILPFDFFFGGTKMACVIWYRINVKSFVESFKHEIHRHILKEHSSRILSEYCTVLKWHKPPFGLQGKVFCSNPLTGPQTYSPIMLLLPPPAMHWRGGNTVAWCKDRCTRQVGVLTGVGVVGLTSHI